LYYLLCSITHTADKYMINHDFPGILIIFNNDKKKDKFISITILILLKLINLGR